MQWTTIRLVLVLGASGLSALASSITLINPSNPSVQQSGQSPCVIGNNPCGSGGTSGTPFNLAYTLVTNGSSYDLFSPTYTVANITAITGSSTFSLGLDLNDNNNPQTIEKVALFVNSAEYQSWVGPLDVKSTNNGTGASDVTFSGFDLSSFGSNATVQFELKMSNLNAGGENLFLIGSSPTTIPEPSSSLLIGTGLVALGTFARRRLKR